MQKYWAVIEGNEGDYQGTVPDVLGAVGVGTTLEEAVESLRESLAVILADLRERGEPLPVLSAKDQVDLSDLEERGVYTLLEISPIDLNPVSLAIERELKDEGISKGEFARRMGVKQPMVSRIIDPTYWGHSSETLRKVARALGAEMQVTFKRPKRDGASATELRV